MAKFVGMWEGYKDGCKQESESILIDQLISLAREFKLDFHQYVPIIQQPAQLHRLDSTAHEQIAIEVAAG